VTVTFIEHSSLILFGCYSGKSSNCFGCASAAVEHCVTLLRALVTNTNLRQILCSQVGMHYYYTLHYLVTIKSIHCDV